MATSRPPFMRARCTCPMEAAAKGRSSKYSSLSRQPGPRSLLSVFWRQRPSRGHEHSLSPGHPEKHPQAAPSHGLQLLPLKAGGPRGPRHPPPPQAPPAHRHLLQRHEVRALPHPLEDLGQVGVDESIIWKVPEIREQRLSPQRAGARVRSRAAPGAMDEAPGRTQGHGPGCVHSWGTTANRQGRRQPVQGRRGRPCSPRALAWGGRCVACKLTQ